MPTDENTKDNKAKNDVADLQHKASAPKHVDAPVNGEVSDDAKAKAEAGSKIEAAHAAEADKAVESHEGLVKMVKHDSTIHVHPTAVESHKSAGWKQA